MDIASFVEQADKTGWIEGRNNSKKNMYCIIEGVVVVKLNNEKHMIIDESDIDILDKHTWRFSEWEKTIRSSRVYLVVSRYILGIEGRNIVVTHKNGNLFDNRRSNLSVISRTRFKSTVRQANNKSGVVGVTFNSDKEAWTATIQYQGKKYSKWFSISLYKEDALYEATEWRKQMMKELGI